MSIAVPLEGFGGGGAALNFDVKAYATEEALRAATPKENTIGIITTTVITSWIFSAVEPAEPVEGMVWFSTGSASGVEFNALKKNAIYIYPLYAQQYINGEWTDLVAMSYRNGEWTEWWDGTLYDAGNEYEAFTGGWKTIGSFTKNADNLSMEITPGTIGTCFTEKPVDLTGYRTLYITVTNISELCVSLPASVPEHSTTSQADAIFNSSPWQLTITSPGTYTLDISETGPCHIWLGNWSTGNRTYMATVHKIWLER